MGWMLETNDPHVFKIWLEKQSWDDLNHAKHTHSPRAHTRSLFIPLFFPPHLAGLCAINSWNWAFANSFIQSVVERQNAHGLWCTPLTGRCWKWWMVAKTTLSADPAPKSPSLCFQSKLCPNLTSFLLIPSLAPHFWLKTLFPLSLLETPTGGNVEESISACGGSIHLRHATPLWKWRSSLGQR